jgi:rubrerythrin
VRAPLSGAQACGRGLTRVKAAPRPRVNMPAETDAEVDMDAEEKVRSVPELYAHALAIEREAAERYRELAERMADEGNGAVAELFSGLAELEGRHAAQLAKECEGMALPPLAPGEYAWLDRGAPERAAHDLIFRLMTPHDALQIALAGERRAQEFFEYVREAAGDAALRDLAGEMAAEEERHAAWVMQALERTPDPNIDWEREFAPRP